ncbi:aminoglycoside phosphotransferase family protein [Dactylosporangium sp. AC04546]|uniref:phosphotransferase enzyme family protein n=1 Tax=Dactylosporangium sp. AC04546 TaxID=2862460 RepID=UPI001EDCB680|nr:aminoglycoside phosphotransferase family protein [Dactylosporangium sp. AC04546]WVK79798.1 aminoglycoside phosphotransferase family protein [Dactylosporangium sp. AC04546]
MRPPEPVQVTEAFGLGRPRGRLVPLAYGTSQTWTLDTGAGRVVVKHVPADGWRDAFARAMAFERRALAAGLPMARPVEPVLPGLGYAAELAGSGLVRVYEWLDGRDLDPGDDVAEWLGGTLARLHAIEPAERAGPQWYHLDDETRWRAWLDQGERLGRAWVPALRKHLPDVLATAAWVERGFARAGDFVLTHRDVEPWNVRMTAAGPVLLDWDGAGPDSAGLELAHAALVFDGGTDRTLRAYREHGGAVPAQTPDLMVRRVGIRLGRLAGRLQMSLGEQPLGPNDRETLDRSAAERLTGLKAFADEVRAMRWYR